MDSMSSQESFTLDICPISIGSHIFREHCEIDVSSRSMSFSYFKNIDERNHELTTHVCVLSELGDSLYFFNIDEEPEPYISSMSPECVKHCIVHRIEPTDNNAMIQSVHNNSYLSRDQFLKMNDSFRAFAKGFLVFVCFSSSDLLLLIDSLQRNLLISKESTNVSFRLLSRAILS